MQYNQHVLELTNQDRSKSMRGKNSEGDTHQQAFPIWTPACPMWMEITSLILIPRKPFFQDQSSIVRALGRQQGVGRAAGWGMSPAQGVPGNVRTCEGPGRQGGGGGQVAKELGEPARKAGKPWGSRFLTNRCPAMHCNGRPSSG